MVLAALVGRTRRTRAGRILDRSEKRCLVSVSILPAVCIEPGI